MIRQYLFLTNNISIVISLILGLLLFLIILFGFLVGIISSIHGNNSIIEIFMNGFILACMALMPIGAFSMGLLLSCSFVYMFYKVISEMFVKETENSNEQIGIGMFVIVSPFLIGISYFLLTFSINNYESFYFLIWNDFQKIIN
jgi:hypothetical protein